MENASYKRHFLLRVRSIRKSGSCLVRHTEAIKRQRDNNEALELNNERVLALKQGTVVYDNNDRYIKIASARFFEKYYNPISKRLC